MSVAMHDGAKEVLSLGNDPEHVGQAGIARIDTAWQVAEGSISALLTWQGEPLEVPESPEVQQYAQQRQDFVPVTAGVGESARYAQDQTAQAEHLAAAEAAVNAVEFVAADVPMAETHAPAPAKIIKPTTTIPYDSMNAVNAFVSNQGSAN
jgi:hypothetical protein